ncbi:MAG: lysophospholipid acyltransferase family protein [Bacteroidota bacterium]|nr:lysophospholipid acyltransferase family protein [Bacteroidota bacterium]
MKERISNIILTLLGWRVIGDVPNTQKYIIIMAPHTSNWDFVIGRCFGYKLKVKAKFLGKSQLFRFPFGWLFRLMGGMPVKREKRNNMVASIVEIFNNSEELILGLAPEGTRSWTDHWKLGFYHIANEANVPIMLSFLDYKTKEAGIGMVLYPSGDFQKDMLKIQTFYERITPKYPDQYNPKIF